MLVPHSKDSRSLSKHGRGAKLAVVTGGPWFDRKRGEHIFNEDDILEVVRQSSAPFKGEHAHTKLLLKYGLAVEASKPEPKPEPIEIDRPVGDTSALGSKHPVERIEEPKRKSKELPLSILTELEHIQPKRRWRRRG
jgi:hypothetical protein